MSFSSLEFVLVRLPGVTHLNGLTSSGTYVAIVRSHIELHVVSA